LGQTGAAQLGAAAMSHGNNMAGLISSGSNAQAASQIAQGNALSGGLSNAYGAYQTNQLMNRFGGGGANIPAWQMAQANTSSDPIGTLATLQKW
jgi:hypothetical protein